MDRPPTTVNSDDILPQVPGNTPKLRLMCSYGGHLIPTPHEKSLRYIGGDTRMVVVDRRSSLASIVSRLSTSLLNGRRNFSLKYQLPNEELDCLVSLSSDEDLENMIEEYDRIVGTASSSSPPFRLRIFIFFSKPETAASMGSLLEDAKSETWFVDALNGVSLLPRGLSDSAAVADQLLDLDNVSVENNEKQITNALDAQKVFAGMSDSYIVENNSSPSFGSSSSSPSMSNLPPIRVRAEESVRVGIEETVVIKSGTPPYPDLAVNNVDFVGRVGEVDRFQTVSEDERSDRSKVQAGFRKPPLPMYLSTQHVQQQNKNGLLYNLPSPDSAASETSITSAMSDSKLLFCQDHVQTTVKENRAPSSPLDPLKQVHGRSPTYQMMQLPETAYLMPSQPSNDVYSQQQHQMQQQQHQFEVQQGRYFNASLQSESDPVQTTVKENMAPGSPLDQKKQVRGTSPTYQTMQLPETAYLMPSKPDNDVYSQQQHQIQQQQQHQLEVQQQQRYFNAMPLSAQVDQHPNSDSQNQRMHHNQERVYLSTPQFTEQQQNLQHQQQHFIHPSMLQSYDAPAVQGQISEQSRQLFQHQQQIQFIPANAQQHVYHPAPNQADQNSQEQQAPQSQQQAIQGSVPHMHQATIGQAPVPSPSYYMYTTQPPHQQGHQQTMYMLPVPQAQPYQTLPQFNNLPDMSLTRYPTQQNATMLPAPAIQTQTQSETMSSSVLMSQNPTLIQHPSSQNQQQYVSYSQFVQPGQPMGAPQVYYSDQHQSNVVPQYQNMNSFKHGHCALPSEAASHPPPIRSASLMADESTRLTETRQESV